MTFSIIVVCLNAGEQLRETVESIRRQSEEDYEIIVKDGANTAEGTPADKLFYDGAWWECEESIYRPHTLLAHCRAQFVMVTESGKEPPPTITTEEEK